MHEKIEHSGHKLQLTPFYALLRGTLTDPAGARFEKTSGYVLSFNYRTTLKMVSQCIKLFDTINKTSNYAKFLHWEKSLHYRGFAFQPNMYIDKSHSKISGTKPNQVRIGQTRDDWAVGIGILAGFPTCSRNTHNAAGVKNDPAQEPRKDIVIEQEDGEIVEE